jgi:hypothetical protein
MLEAIMLPLDESKTPTPEVDNFDWSARNPDVLATYQPALAVYTNGYGHIVLRAERGGFDDEDTVILVSTENAPRLIARLNKLLQGLTNAS